MPGALWCWHTADLALRRGGELSPDPLNRRAIILNDSPVVLWVVRASFSLVTMVESFHGEARCKLHSKKHGEKRVGE